jgi:uncharacterized protein YkwD
MKTIFKTATQKQINTILRLHNQYRLHHGVDPLVYDPEISEISQSYADQMYQAATDTFTPSGNTYAGNPFSHFLKIKIYKIQKISLPRTNLRLKR